MIKSNVIPAIPAIPAIPMVIQEQVVVFDASRQSDCIDVLRLLSHSYRETCSVRASFDLYAKCSQVLICSHRLGEDA